MGVGLKLGVYGKLLNMTDWPFIPKLRGEDQRCFTRLTEFSLQSR